MMSVQNSPSRVDLAIRHILDNVLSESVFELVFQREVIHSMNDFFILYILSCILSLQPQVEDGNSSSSSGSIGSSSGYGSQSAITVNSNKQGEETSRRQQQQRQQQEPGWFASRFLLKSSLCFLSPKDSF